MYMSPSFLTFGFIRTCPNYNSRGRAHAMTLEHHAQPTSPGIRFAQTIQRLPLIQPVPSSRQAPVVWMVRVCWNLPYTLNEQRCPCHDGSMHEPLGQDAQLCCR